MTRACHQGGWVVFSLLLWNLVVNELLGELNEGSYYAAGYDDDNTILINGKFPQSQRYWEQPLDWYSSGDRINLSINPSKMVVIPFTRKRALKGLKNLIGKTVQLSTEVKYLRLMCSAQVENVMNRAFRAF
jgi:hypothetical protein